MPDSQSTEAERIVQRFVSFGSHLTAALIAIAVLLAHAVLRGLPSRAELGARTAELRLKPAFLGAAAFAPLRLLAAWRVTSADPRFGGVSAMTIEGDQLIALSDSGVVVRFAKPRPGDRAISAVLDELPDGPGSASSKVNRDAEAVVADPAGRGWWVAFEYRHQLWLYDLEFGQVITRIALPAGGWARNRGVEGLAAGQGWLWLFPETGKRAFRYDGKSFERLSLDGLGGRFPWQGWIAEAATLRDGRLVLAERRLGPWGFDNSLVVLDRDARGFRPLRRYRLPLAATDNIEAIAVDGQPDGSTRLWLMSDNDRRRRTETLLLLVELPR